MRRLTLFIVVSLTATPLIAKPEAYFSRSGQIQKHLLTDIAQTQKTLDIALFELTAKPLIRALEEAHRRGVYIRLVIDTGVEHVPVGIDVRRLGGRQGQGIMHNKFAVFDERCVTTGSYNWTNNAEHTNYENMIREDDPDIVHAYQMEFSRLWSDASPFSQFFSRHKSRRTHAPKKYRTTYF